MTTTLKTFPHAAFTGLIQRLANSRGRELHCLGEFACISMVQAGPEAPANFSCLVSWDPQHFSRKKEREHDSNTFSFHASSIEQAKEFLDDFLVSKSEITKDVVFKNIEHVLVAVKEVIPTKL